MKCFCKWNEEITWDVYVLGDQVLCGFASTSDENGIYITQSKYVKGDIENFWIERFQASKHTYGDRP